MDTQLYALSKPATARASGHADFVVLSFEADGGTASVYLPKRMQACVDMIVEAFNAHMEDTEPKLEPYVEMTDGAVLHGIKAAEALAAPQIGDWPSNFRIDPKVDPVEVSFPTGAATAMGLAMIYAAGLEADDKGRHLVNLPFDGTDDHAAHVVERSGNMPRWEMSEEAFTNLAKALYTGDDADVHAAIAVERRDLP